MKIKRFLKEHSYEMHMALNVIIGVPMGLFIGEIADVAMKKTNNKLMKALVCFGGFATSFGATLSITQEAHQILDKMLMHIPDEPKNSNVQ